MKNKRYNKKRKIKVKQEGEKRKKKEEGKEGRYEVLRGLGLEASRVLRTVFSFLSFFSRVASRYLLAVSVSLLGDPRGLTAMRGGLLASGKVGTPT